MSSHGILSSFPCFLTEGASPTVRDRFAACVNPEAMSRKKADNFKNNNNIHPLYQPTHTIFFLSSLQFRASDWLVKKNLGRYAALSSVVWQER